MTGIQGNDDGDDPDDHVDEDRDDCGKTGCES